LPSSNPVREWIAYARIEGASTLIRTSTAIPPSAAKSALRIQSAPGSRFAPPPSGGRSARSRPMAASVATPTWTTTRISTRDPELVEEREMVVEERIEGLHVLSERHEERRERERDEIGTREPAGPNRAVETDRERHDPHVIRIIREGHASPVRVSPKSEEAR